MKVSLALGGWMVEVWDGQGQCLVLWIRLLVGQRAEVGPEVEALPLAPGEGLSGIQGSPQVEVGSPGGPGGERAGSQAPGKVESGVLPDSAAAAAARGVPVAAAAAEDSSAAAVGFWPGLLGAVLEADPP